VKILEYSATALLQKSCKSLILPLTFSKLQEQAILFCGNNITFPSPFMLFLSTSQTTLHHLALAGNLQQKSNILKTINKLSTLDIYFHA
jgi:hypothetical protein